MPAQRDARLVKLPRMVGWMLIGMLALMLLVGVAYSYFSERRQRRTMLETLIAARESGDTLDDKAFAAACGPDIPSDLARRVRMVILEISDDWMAPPQGRITLEDIRPQTHLWDQLGGKFDSLSALDLALRLEKALELRFTGRWLDGDDFRTVASVVRGVTREVRKAGRI